MGIGIAPSLNHVRWGAWWLSLFLMGSFTFTSLQWFPLMKNQIQTLSSPLLMYLPYVSAGYVLLLLLSLLTFFKAKRARKTLAWQGIDTRLL
jgi:hypothetical protein